MQNHNNSKAGKDNFMQNNQYKRLLFIDNIISSGLKPTWKGLIALLQDANFKTSRASVFRDLKDLKEQFHAPLCTNENGGYYYREATFRIPALLTSEEQIEAAKIMRNLLETLKGSTIYDDAVQVFDTLSTTIPLSENFRSNESKSKFGTDQIDNIQERIIFLGVPNVELAPSVWRFVYSAIQKNQIIVFNYRTVSQKQDVQHAVAPYQLIFENGNWNLWGFEYKSKKRLLFTLSQMKDLHLHSQKGETFEFSLPKDFDFRETTPATFGCYTTPFFETYKINLKNYAARYAKNRIWGNEQNITETNDGITLEFESNQYEPILRWVLSWSEDAIPLEPERLVKDWKAHIQKMAENCNEKQ